MNQPKENAPVKALFDLVDAMPAALDQLKRTADELLPFIRYKGAGDLAAMVSHSLMFCERQCKDEVLGEMTAGGAALLHCHMMSLQQVLRWWAISNYP